jgi:hypothetical protein
MSGIDLSRVRFDRHARRRMKWRQISEDEVHLALENPDKIEESIRGRTNAYKFIGERYIKVTYREFSDEILIISVVDKGKGERSENRIQ